MCPLQPSWVVGVDIGGTKIRLGLLNIQGDLQHLESLWSRDFKGLSNVDQALAEVVHQYIMRMGIPWEHLVGVVVGVPATLDRQEGFIYSCPNFRNLEGKRIRTTFQAYLPVPVWIERDTNLAVLGEHWKGAAQGYQDVLGVFVGTGLGCGIILNGRLHVGSHGVAAELGHIPVPSKDELCNCGNLGCIELYAAGVALERGLQESPDQESNISELFTRASQGDAFWRLTLDRFIEMLSIAVATAVNILDPQIVVIGGGISCMKDFPFEELTRRVFAHTRKPEPARSLLIVRSALGDQAGLIGAARFITMTPLSGAYRHEQRFDHSLAPFDRPRHQEEQPPEGQAILPDLPSPAPSPRPTDHSAGSAAWPAARLCAPAPVPTPGGCSRSRTVGGTSPHNAASANGKRWVKNA